MKYKSTKIFFVFYLINNYYMISFWFFLYINSYINIYKRFLFRKVHKLFLRLESKMFIISLKAKRVWKSLKPLKILLECIESFHLIYILFTFQTLKVYHWINIKAPQKRVLLTPQLETLHIRDYIRNINRL